MKVAGQPLWADGVYEPVHRFVLEKFNLNISIAPQEPKTTTAPTTTETTTAPPSPRFELETVTSGKQKGKRFVGTLVEVQSA